ncbi:hypothetical protein CVT26_015536 [Gymnopilus dilepis]|uniref:Uncharacterized protein n=1 Tax=Gymnopilus dilepis TaxID=231916 RepID=A0A409YD38_9AGAR|nr:hypothetical protein CVT26_015536 [Gymnopilus dilepis]
MPKARSPNATPTVPLPGDWNRPPPFFQSRALTLPLGFFVISDIRPVFGASTLSRTLSNGEHHFGRDTFYHEHARLELAISSSKNTFNFVVISLSYVDSHVIFLIVSMPTLLLQNQVLQVLQVQDGPELPAGRV